jgi:hypothetical protein
MAQVTSVVQLADVQPTDWAYQAVRSLIERYGCLAGYPNATWGGERAMSRDEFAAGLNACLHQMQALLTATTTTQVHTADLQVMQQLQEAFAAELASLRGRIATLETRTATLEAQSFAPTMKLRAFSVILAADTWGDRATPTARSPDNTELFLAQYTRLNLLSSFTGKDLLTASLTATNVPLLSTFTGSPMTNLVTDPALTLGPNGLALDRLHYQLAVGDRTTVWLGLRALQPYDFLPTVNPVIVSLDGPASRFSWYNPAVYRTGFESVGAGIAYKFSPVWQVHLAYLMGSGTARDPAVGLFNGNNSAIAQVTFTPSPRVTAALTYTYKYFRAGTANVFGFTGSPFALQPFGLNPTAAHNGGLQFNWRLTNRLSVGGWFGYTQADQVNDTRRDATMLNGLLNVTALNLFHRGDRAGLIIGIPPKVIRSNFDVSGTRRQDLDTSLHLETFYTYRLNDNVSVTPNLYVILNPNHNVQNEAIWVGVVRTNFSF